MRVDLFICMLFVSISFFVVAYMGSGPYEPSPHELWPIRAFMGPGRALRYGRELFSTNVSWKIEDVLYHNITCSMRVLFVVIHSSCVM